MKEPIIKYVKKASSWCKTYWVESAKGPQQKQEWFRTKKEAKEDKIEEK